MYRRINSAIWDDGKFMSLNPNEKAVCLYLLTNKHTNIHGIYRAELKNISKETGLDNHFVGMALITLIKYRLIEISERGNYKLSKKIMSFIWWTHGKGGELSGNWKGGITPINAKIRASDDYKYWRMSVFIRDNFTCQSCNKTGVKINAHHIKHFSKYPELRFALSNGITLCEKCHKKNHRKKGN